MSNETLKESGSSNGSSGQSVSDSIRTRLRERKSGLVSWSDLSGGDASKRAAIQLELSRMTRDSWSDDLAVPVMRPCQGVYYFGDGEPDPYLVARKVMETLGKSADGIGYANASAAHNLKLSDTRPEVAEIGFPHRPPQQPSGLKARWVSRSGCLGRITVNLTPPEICVLEVLRDPELITMSRENAIEILLGLIERSQVDTSNLVAASKTEPPVVREGLRNLLTALGRSEADAIPPTLNRAVRARAFLGRP